MVLKSEYSIPRPKQPIHLTILERYEWMSREHPQQCAFKNSSNHADNVNYSQCREIIIRIASYLNTSGFKKGEVAAIALPNCWQFPLFMIGAWTTGMTTSAMSAKFTKYEIRHQIEDSEAVVMFTDDTLLNKVLEATRGNTRIRQIICLQTSASVSFPHGIVPFATVLNTLPTFDPYSIDFDMDEDLIMLPYSSGTTGTPKGVMITHLNFAYILDIFIHNEKIKWASSPLGPNFLVGKTTLAVLPQYHAMGMYSTLAVSYMGIQQIMFRSFDMEIMLQHVEQFKVSILYLVPAILLKMAVSPFLDKYDLSSLTSITSGAAPLGKTTIEKLVQKLPNLQFTLGYGMTELTVSSHVCFGNQPRDSVGQLNVNMEMKVLDPETGKECGPMEIGELFLRGPVVMKGYKNRPEETRKAFDKEGFLRTGDLVYYDSNGFMFVCERSKELIKVIAMQVAPAELENLLLGIEGVLDCAVVGISHETFGEVPRAYIVRRNGLKEEKIHEYVDEHVAHYKRLVGGISFVETIPRTPTGKILRRQLKDEYMKKRKSKL